MLDRRAHTSTTGSEEAVLASQRQMVSFRRTAKPRLHKFRAYQRDHRVSQQMRPITCACNTMQTAHCLTTMQWTIYSSKINIEFILVTEFLVTFLCYSTPATPVTPCIALHSANIHSMSFLSSHPHGIPIDSMHSVLRISSSYLYLGAWAKGVEDSECS